MQQPQVILITGVSSGFGKISAQMLAEKGHIVYGTSRKAETTDSRISILLKDVPDSASIHRDVELNL